MSNATACAVPGCGKPVKRGGFCYGHYMKNWRYGTPTPEHPDRWEDLTGRRFGTLLLVERIGSRWRCICDCGRERLALVGDLNRAGDANTCGDRRTHRRADDAGYTAAHQRVRRDRGPISAHQCVDCGAPARHWSYNHDDEDERLAHGLSAHPVAYSLNPEHYSPRCVPCHKRFDLGRRDSAPIRVA
jgi:hypothetical protein